MITSLQFDAALQTISDYKIQLEIELNIEKPLGILKIDIQKSVNPTLFNVLRNYYFDEYAIDLRWDDLKTMEISLLKKIDFNKLRRYRSFGVMSAFKFKEMLVKYLILEPIHY